MTSPKWYDITIKASEEKDCPYTEQMKILREKFEDDAPIEKYVFQLEKGEKTGFLHWQCRVKYKKGRSVEAVIKEWSPWHVSVTSAKGRNWDYVTKDDTCVSIAYRFISDAPSVEAFVDVIENQPKGWQEIAWQKLLAQGNRKVLTIIDESGCNGKSWLSKWLVYHHKAWEVFPCETSKEMMGQVVAGVENNTCDIFVFDLTRAEGKTAGAMWSAVEMIKDGRAYDTRYHDKRVYFKSPAVIVFTNDKPQKKWLSADRWDAYTIEESIQGITCLAEATL